MTEEAFGGYSEVRSHYLTNRRQGNAGYDPGNCRYNTQMSGLAQPASSFLLSVGVSVRSDLQKEKKRQKRKSQRQ